MGGVVGAGHVQQFAGFPSGFLALAKVVLIDHVLRDQARQADAPVRGCLDVKQMDARGGRALGQFAGIQRGAVGIVGAVDGDKNVQHGCSLMRYLTSVTGSSVRCRTRVATDPMNSDETEPKPREPM
ncbi:hypothetical protein D3C87_1847660 [compost metagenome]